MVEKTRIWYLIGSLEVGGAERTLVDLVSGLDRDRFAPEIWTIREAGPLATEVPEGVPVRSLAATSKLDVRAVVRFVREVRRRRPDVLQSFLFFDNVLARLASVVSPKTTVITGVRAVPTDPPRVRRLIDRVTQPLSDCVVSNSKAGARYIHARGVPEHKIRVIHNGRDIDRFATAAESLEFREQLDISAESRIVGTVGRLIERKGHYDLLDAWQHVQCDYPDSHLVIVGDGPERNGLVERAERNGVANSVHLVGRRDDVPELLATFDLFVFPSHFEGLPGALLEAMAAGLPIVTTPVDGCSELVKDGEHGLHVPSKEPRALADGLESLLADPELATTLGLAARERAREAFSLQRMVSAFEATYDDLTR